MILAAEYTPSPLRLMLVTQGGESAGPRARGQHAGGFPGLLRVASAQV